MIVYLVRHAEYEKRKDATDGELVSAELSPYGRLQAHAAGKKLKTFGIRKIFASPITRARETADIISARTGIPVVVDERLREFFADPNVRDPLRLKESKKEARDNPDRIVSDGESYNAAIARLESVITEISSTEKGRNVCLVSHRVVIEGFLARHFHIREDEHEWLAPASITALSVNGENIDLLFFDKVHNDFPLLFKKLKRKLFRSY